MPAVVILPPSAPHIDAYKVAVKYATDIISGNIVAGKLLKLTAKRFIQDLKFGSERGITFNREAAQHVIDFFGCLRHSKGEWGKQGGQPFILAPWQVFILANLFGFKRLDGTRRFHEAHIEVARKNGKALALDTPTPTPQGWRMFGDLAVGDAVFDEQGAVQYVTYCTDVMQGHSCYKITFDDDSTIVTDAEHRWLVESRQPGNGTRGKKRQREDNIRTTEELRKRLRIKHEYNHKIRLTAPLQYPEKNYPIDPYFLGLWLGDGDTSGVTVTTGDQEIKDYLRRYAEQLGLTATEFENTENSSRVAIRDATHGKGKKHTEAFGRNNTLQARLRALGVLGNKHIPKEYLCGSIEQRFELLRGLMDTDGYCSKAGLCEITLTSLPLIRDFQELIRSLGYAGRIQESRATLAGRDCGPRYRVQLWPRDGDRIFCLKRKQDRVRLLRDERTRKIAIVSIEHVKSVPVKCIRVSGPSHLFLVGDAMVPTHNTTIMSGIALYMLVADDEPGAEIYCIATKKEQAREVFDEAVRMARKSPLISKRVTISGGKFPNCISILGTASKFQLQASDYGTADGKNVHCLIADELHQHPTRLLYDAYYEATAARQQPLVIAITTAGYDTTSICFAQRKIAENILVGNVAAVYGDAVFAFIACIDEPDKDGKNGDDWQDEACWPKANPNLGISVKMDNMREAYAKATIDPTSLNGFLCKRLNVWTSQEIRWMPPEKWARCNVAGPLSNPRTVLDAALVRLVGRVCIGALDLSSKIDLTAFVLLFPPVKARYEKVPLPQTQEEKWNRVPVKFEEKLVDPGDPYWSVLPWFWVPEGCIEERVKKDRVRYDVWQKLGYLNTCPGSTIDHEFIYKHIVGLRDKYRFTNIAFDAWNAQWISNKLLADGFKAEPVRMTYQVMSEPMKELMGLVLEKKLEHFGHPILAWNAGNVSATTDANGSIRPDKEKSKEKIDGVVALIMALSQICKDPTTAGGSGWDYSKGLTFL